MPAWYIRLEGGLAKTLLVLITLLVFVAALSRTIGHPVIWSDDMAQLLFVWLCVIAAVRAVRLQAHIGVDLLVRRLPRTPRWLLDLGNGVLVLAFLVTLAVAGYQLMILNWQRIYGDSGLSYAWVTGAIPAGCALMGIELLIHMVRSVRHRALVFYPDKSGELDRPHSQLG